MTECELNESVLPRYRQLLTDSSQLDSCREIHHVPDLLQQLKATWHLETVTDNELLNSLHWCNQQQLTVDVEQLSQHWLPYRYDPKTRNIQWCLPDSHATEPFHDEYIGRCQRSLLINQFVRPRTSLNVLLAGTTKLIQPAGFIFHLSRCGSTLLSGCLSELDDTCILSESQLLTDILLDESLIRDDKTRVLPRLIHLQGSSIAGRSKIIIKWNAWDIFSWHLLRELYSETPVILLVRNPLEILASHARQAGRHMSGDKSLSALHPVFAEHRHGGVRELRIQVLRELMGEMLNVADEPGVELIDYDALDETRIEQAAEHFGLTIKADERLHIRRRMTVHSKQPDKVFHADGQAKQREVSDSDRDCAWSKLGATYQELVAKGTTAPMPSKGVEAFR